MSVIPDLSTSSAGRAGAGVPGALSLRAATSEDVPAVARVFGRAFDDYRRGFGVDAGTLAELWRASLGARVDATTIAVLPEGRVAGFIVTVRPGARERYGGNGEARRRLALWHRTLGWSAFWRLPALFIPMGLAYACRPPRRDELYVSLVGVDPDLQGRGIGQALLAAAEREAQACGAAAVLLHTASTNARARAAYARAGYELVCTVRAPWPGPAQIPAYVALRKPLRPDPSPVLDATATRPPLS